MIVINIYILIFLVIICVFIFVRVDFKVVFVSFYVYEFFIKVNFYVVYFEQWYFDVLEVVDDFLFFEFGIKLQVFIVVDWVFVIFGFGVWGIKEVGILCVMQSFDYGVWV